MHAGSEDLLALVLPPLILAFRRCEAVSPCQSKISHAPRESDYLRLAMV